ncbi:sporulation integral membrane protein YtvI [Rossellomorea vietnamensis]|uniref:Sporulation integral membrane protein YtvI n=1 Tax=Rossellomorea vietnamensis TaxID=218284 RepID=A0A5D4KLD3_9BACI|nr:sporulation integral membrane protein YtvI [Rossellomorea vietnamensis]TYR77649.1 sporulation integral membrane protein YtvI [Rossellomorea vietnamensis]
MTKFLSKKMIMISITVIFTILLLYYILPVSIPLIAAIVTALLLDPAVKMLERRFKIKRKLAVLVVFIIFILSIGVISYFVITKVVGEGVKLVEDIPLYINQLSDIWLSYEKQFTNAAKDLPIEIVKETSREVQDFLNSFKSSLKEYLDIEKISAFLAYIPNYLVSFLVFLIALFMFMLDLPRIKQTIFNHLTEKTAEKVNFMTSRLSYVIFGFFKAQFLVSIIIFVAALIGLLFISPEVAVVMSIIIWIIDFIPLIGSIVVLAPWAIFHLLSGNLTLGTELAILAAVLLIIRRTVEPKVMGSHIGLSPLATLIAMYLGLKLLGVLGFILGPLILIVFNSAKEAGIIKMNFKI